MFDSNEGAFARKPVENLLSAKSVAIVGASPKGRWPAGIYRNLKAARYSGKIFLINPNYSELWDERCYPNVAALPEVPEHLLMLIPTKAVLPTLEEATRLGTKAATVYSAGFGEGDDPEGKRRAEGLKELCGRTGLIVCGPNCMGSFSVAEGLWSFPTPVPLLKHGPVGLVFQSGGSLGNWIKGASERGIGFTYAVSSGNEVSADLVDYLAFLIEHPETRLIALMIEGVRRPQAFMAVAAEALKKTKPILVVKLGRSEMGQRQALSHTGALAGSDEVFDAVCKRLGLIRVPTLEDLTETTLAFLPARYPRGSRAAIVVNSGGMKGLLCDHCAELHTNLAELSPQTKAAVRPLIPPELAVENPLECGVAGFGDEQGFINIVKLHAEDPGVDLLAIHGELPRFPEKREATLFKDLSAASEKPILAFARATYSLTEESRVFQEEAGIPFLQGIKPTLRALAALGSYGDRLRSGMATLPPAGGDTAELEGERLHRLLENHGITLPRQSVVASPSDAAARAEEIGFPVALKLVAPSVVHKTESGAVVLGLHSRRDVEIQGARLLSLAPGARLLVQEMVEGTEMILGARTDPQYGPFLIIGLGGIFVEVLRDMAVRLLPVSEADARAMLGELRGYKILEGIRGQPPRDTAALVRAMVGLSNIFTFHREHLSDLEFNPIMVRAEGMGVAAVDVRLIRK
ncbi:MAG TPA: acetate--CoA ligase family protein [Candidatus Eisenbacteria bacterium]|nr:acetate--CoA ligase family protein [Candidatus Eisenbacteria bacterium]